MKRFKKIYLEITNACNLNCSFCNKNNRNKSFMNIDDFNYILNEIRDYTDYLYFHVMGEPLFHPDINELIDIASKSFKINLTTNGVFLDKVINNKNIRQINISLHSLENKSTLKEDLIKILENADKFENTIINYRLWVKNDLSEYLINIINEFYETDINLNENNYKIKDKLFISSEEKFIWPNLENKISFEQGTCLGLKDHIGILVDGTVVPCCLDSNGIIKLGNIFDSPLKEILNSERSKNIVDGFNKNISCEPLCKKCNFYDKRKLL